MQMNFDMDNDTGRVVTIKVVGVGGGVAVAAGISGGLRRRGVLCRLRGAGAEGQKHGNHRNSAICFFIW